MIQFYKLSRFELLKGEFPLNHDTVLKVVYSDSFQYFTCKNEDSTIFTAIVSMLVAVRYVEISSVDDFEIIDFDTRSLGTHSQKILKDYSK